jgi:NTP pyrophosphatase (non-canonical NTP hydrolase)
LLGDDVDPDTYQRLAARTECDQEKVARRMAGPYPADPESLGVSTLLPVRVNHGVLGLAGEVGELAAAVERWLYYGHELDVVNVAEEVGDCLWYLAELCNAVGFSLSSVMEANIRKLRARYPDRYTDAQTADRDPVAERRALSQAADHTPRAEPAPWRPPLASAARLLDLAEASDGRAIGLDGLADNRSMLELTLQAGFRGVLAREIEDAPDWLAVARHCIELDRQRICGASAPTTSQSEVKPSSEVLVQNGHGWAEPACGPDEGGKNDV